MATPLIAPLPAATTTTTTTTIAGDEGPLAMRLNSAAFAAKVHALNDGRAARRARVATSMHAVNTCALIAAGNYIDHFEGLFDATNRDLLPSDLITVALDHSSEDSDTGARAAPTTAPPPIAVAMEHYSDSETERVVVSAKRAALRRAATTDARRRVINRATVAATTLDESSAQAVMDGQREAVTSVPLRDPTVDTMLTEDTLRSSRLQPPEPAQTLTDVLERMPMVQLHSDDLQQMEELWRRGTGDVLLAAGLPDVSLHTTLAAGAAATPRARDAPPPLGNIDPARASRPMTDRDPPPAAARQEIRELRLLQERAQAVHDSAEGDDDAAEAANMAALGDIASASALLQAGRPLDQRQLNELLCRGYTGPTNVGSQSSAMYMALRLLRAYQSRGAIDSRFPISETARREAVLSHCERMSYADLFTSTHEAVSGDPPCRNGISCQGIQLNSPSEHFVLASYKYRQDFVCALCALYTSGNLVIQNQCDHRTIPANRQCSFFYNPVGVPDGFHVEDCTGPTTSGYYGIVDPIVVLRDQVRVVRKPHPRTGAMVRFMELPYLRHPDPAQPIGQADGAGGGPHVPSHFQ